MRTRYGYQIKCASGGFKKIIIIDGKGHLMGRLAAIVAKKLLQGQSIAVVRCEEINMSGSLYRRKLKWAEFRRIRMNTNPRRGPFHLRHPSDFFKRVVRGMLPHKTKRGAYALSKLDTFEGIPPKYTYKARVVVPRCLTALKLQPGRNFCKIGDLSKEVGWSYSEEVAALEEKRKVRSATYFKGKVEKIKRRKAAIEASKSETAKYDKILAQYGML
ncbi:uncharacterized protein LOC142358188 [Convolutriloba macropyga]|uniref:uncharacterized protein LOC142345532 n=1 Tax=Convolutriloba macropyga TaxID=536237 RepID=UPI003F51D293